MTLKVRGASGKNSTKVPYYCTLLPVPGMPLKDGIDTSHPLHPEFKGGFGSSKTGPRGNQTIREEKRASRPVKTTGQRSAGPPSQNRSVGPPSQRQTRPIPSAPDLDARAKNEERLAALSEVQLWLHLWCSQLSLNPLVRCIYVCGAFVTSSYRPSFISLLRILAQPLCHILHSQASASDEHVIAPEGHPRGFASPHVHSYIGTIPTV